MKLLTFITIISTSAAATSFSCPSGDIGACCEAYDPGDKLGYECQEAAREIFGGTSTWSCDDPIDIFSECCSQNATVTSASPWPSCTPGKIA